MSSIKTTEIEGDVSVGRHVSIGGNANVQGNATVKKNLKVEGWLDAKNIKGPNKGNLQLSRNYVRHTHVHMMDGGQLLDVACQALSM